jgi:hypothetical protein
MEEDKPKERRADQDHVMLLIEKASMATDHDQAMKYSQAALNAANALSTLDYIKQGKR